MTESSSRPRLLQTPSQTIGPFFAFALPYDGGPRLVDRADPRAIRLWGTVYDGADQPVPDAIVEVWQPDADGVIPRELGSLDRDGYTFTGFGRDATTRAGRYGFTTVRPGGVAGAPYALVTVFARGLTHHLFTRAYFPDIDGGDALLASLPTERRETLLVVETAPGEFRFDIRLQGDRETVFLDFDSHSDSDSDVDPDGAAS